MALQVWLPLTKDLRQQGLSDVTVTNNGATFDSSGKLGGCYSFDGTDDRIYANNVSISNSAMSACCWVKLNNLTSADYPYIFALGSNTSGPGIQIGLSVWKSDSKIHLVGNGSEPSSGYTPPINTWIHLCITISGATTKLYVNGVLTSTQTNANSPKTQTCLCLGARPNSTSGAGVAFSYPINGYISDFRLYDHCLSSMEVKQLSQGLVLHYPLSDNSIQQLNNCYNYPTFNTSSTSGGWSHWGQSGASGSYGQTTDSQYIYRKDQSYAHWFANAAGATGDYLLYQSPAFEGGKRSVQCICKEENGLPIEESIVRPVWNARSGGAINGEWTSITLLDNDFYYCKCENIQQSGSDDLVGFYIKPGYKVYFSEAYLEDNRDVSSDIFFPTNVVYDCSGFCNNGNISGTLTVSNDTPKYRVSTAMLDDSAARYIYADTQAQLTKEITMSCWFKQTESESTTGTTKSQVEFVMSQGRDWYTTGCSLLLTNGAPKVYAGNVDEYEGLTHDTKLTGSWHHMAATYKDGTLKLYVDGVLSKSGTCGDLEYTYAPKFVIGKMAYSYTSTTSYFPYIGYISDVRIYATALSADDVKSLYQNCATIDTDGTIHGQIRS